MNALNCALGACAAPSCCRPVLRTVAHTTCGASLPHCLGSCGIAACAWQARGPVPSCAGLGGLYASAGGAAPGSAAQRAALRARLARQLAAPLLVGRRLCWRPAAAVPGRSAAGPACHRCVRLRGQHPAGYHPGPPPAQLGTLAPSLFRLAPAPPTCVVHARSACTSGTGSPVTALSSYRLGRNTTVLLSGHASGELRLHLLHHPPAPSGSGDSGWEAAEDEWEAATAAGTGSGAPLRMSLMHALPPEALLCGCSSGGATGTCTAIGEQAPAASGDTQAASAMPAAGSPPRCPPITAVHASGRGGNVASTAVVVDAAGALAVLKHGGAAYRGGESAARLSLLAPGPLLHPGLLRLPRMPRLCCATHCRTPGCLLPRPHPLAACSAHPAAVCAGAAPRGAAAAAPGRRCNSAEQPGVCHSTAGTSRCSRHA